MTSLRLPAEVERKIFSFVKTRNQSKSAVIPAAKIWADGLPATYKKPPKEKILAKYRSC
jgi:hypothetical protein